MADSGPRDEKQVVKPAVEKKDDEPANKADPPVQKAESGPVPTVHPKLQHAIHTARKRDTIFVKDASWVPLAEAYIGKANPKELKVQHKPGLGHCVIAQGS